MSFNDPGFLFSTRQTDQERESERLEMVYRQQVVERCYRRATWVVVLAMLWISLPTGLEKWHWHVVAGAGVLMLVLAVMMMLKGALKKALLTLLFAGVILPIWIEVAPKVISVVKAQLSVIVKEWQRVL